MEAKGPHFSTLLNSLLEGLEDQPNPFRWAWNRLHTVPFGHRIFSKLLGRYVPYSGSIHAEVLQLDAGYARVQMQDRRALRNHLDSVHAIALSNLAELTGNLALVYSMPDDARFIVRGISVEFLKKARGTITAECRCPIPSDNTRREYVLDVTMRNDDGDEVAHAKLTSLVGPKKP